MRSVKEDEIVQADIVPCAAGTFGIGYVTADGRQGMEQVGSKELAEEIVRRVAMRRTTSSDAGRLFPLDIAAS